MHKSGEFPDWVITAAFYSAIHYVDDCLFPGSYALPNGQTKNCNSIDHYYRHCYASEPKHEIRTRLVEDQFPEIMAAFKWLKEQSSNMRYLSYQVSEDEASKAVEYLDEIREFHSDNHQ